MQPLAFLLYHRRHNAASLNTLVGALNAEKRFDCIQILYARSFDALVQQAYQALSSGRRIIVGWSFFSAGFPAYADELNEFKRQINHPNVQHIAGGMHATACPLQTLQAGFDWVFIGEGEHTIRDFFDCLLTGADPGSISGLAYLKEGAMHSNGYGKRICLDAFPPFAEKQGRFNAIEITRGCIYSCKFCQTPYFYKARFRHRSPANAAFYADAVKRRGLRDVRFLSPTSLSYGSEDGSVHLSAVENLLYSVRQALGSNGRIYFGTFPSEIRPEHISREALTLLKQYVANDNLVIGGQSGSETALQECHRNHSVSDILTAVDLCKSSGFIPNVDLIFGLPSKDENSDEATISLAEILVKMGAQVHAHTFMPLPGTPYQNKSPGKINRILQGKMDRLASRRLLYGQWMKQIHYTHSKTRSPFKNSDIT